MSFELIPLSNWERDKKTFAFQGHEIAYWTAGSGKPLLLIHGYPTAAWDWSFMWTEMAKTRRVIACDMLGFGYSDKPKSGYSIHRQADIQSALLSECDVTAFDALVHDYGVSVGQELLARRNAGIDATGLEKMCFLNGGLLPEQHRPRGLQKLGTSPLGWLLGFIVNRKRFGKAFGQIFGEHTKPSDEELDIFWKLITQNGGLHRMHSLLHYISDRKQHGARWVEALASSEIPLKIINGAQDPVSGRHLRSEEHV